MINLDEFLKDAFESRYKQVENLCKCNEITEELLIGWNAEKDEEFYVIRVNGYMPFIFKKEDNGFYHRYNEG